ncbi:MAG: glycosyltransferase family 2 protein [Magnetococcales bacterium]|nr:glycosyltransferase family 2 protein [Magnetococcales bacterium]
MILVLLPAYNEEESLPKLMPKLQQTLAAMNEEFKILVCNDGSRDRTQSMLEEYAKEMPVEIIRHKINRGLGESTRDLFELASEMARDGDVIVRLDCDDTHEPEFIPRIVERVRSGCDVVIASRFAPGGGQLGVNGYRAFISRSANLFMKVFFPIPGLREYSCGFRGYRAEKIKEAVAFYGNNFIQLKGLGFTCTLEKLVKLRLINARFGEVPFLLRYDQKLSTSKMVSSVTTLGYVVMTILYYWPWGGWRMAIRNKHHVWNLANDQN